MSHFLKQLSILTFPLLSILISACANEYTAEEYGYLPEKPVEDTRIYSFSDSTVHTLRVRNIGPLGRVFRDLNDEHLKAASENGISPIRSLKDAYKVNRQVVRVETCDEFYLDTLQFSMPYLRPFALELLKDLGRSFTDTIKARSGGHSYRIRVTSVLRTAESVGKLRRRNRNASENSSHQYGTTFDVSYVRFIPGQADYRLSDGSLKNVLAEVLYDLRRRGRCLVKYERKQGCFHITALPPDDN